MRSIVEFALAQRFLVLALTLLLVLLGVRGYQKLPVDAVPDITSVQVQVLTRAPGLSPIEVENLVTRPIERAMAGLPRVSNMRSVSRSAVSGVTLVFDDEMPLNQARELVSQRLTLASAEVTEAAERPQMGPLTTGLGEVYHFTLDWPGHSSADTKTLFEWEIARELLLVPGVVEVNSWGGDEREFQVRLRSADLQAFGLTAEDVERSLLLSGHTVGGGALVQGEEQVLVRTDGQYRSIFDLENQVVKNVPGRSAILVRDVANVVAGEKPRFSAATADGKGPSQYAMVQMVAQGNAHQVVQLVQAKLRDIEKRLPEGVQIEPFYDRAFFVERVLRTVFRSLLEGGLFVAMVLFLFLGNFRAGLVVATVIPLSMLGAFACMQAFGISGNLMSLGAIDFGLVVDGAVVLVEGTLFGLNRGTKDVKSAFIHDAQMYGRSLLLGVLLIAVVYIPILLLEGVEGKMFRPMALTVLFALGTAIILTFTWVPAIGSIVLRKEGAREPTWVGRLRQLYRPRLAFFVQRPALSWLAVSSVALLGLLVGSTLGADFVPRLEEGDMAIQVTRPPSISLAEAELGTTEVENALLELPEVRRVVSRTGSPDVATDLMGIEQSDVFVLMHEGSKTLPPEERERLIARMEKALVARLPGSSFGFTQPIEMRMQELLGGIKSDVGVRVYGENFAELGRVSADVMERLSKVRGTSDLRIEPSEGLPLMTLRADPARLARFGVRPDVLETTIAALGAGRTVGTLFDSGRPFDVSLRWSTHDILAPDRIGEFRVPLGPGREARLAEVTDILLEDIPAQLSREQGRRRLLIEANVRGRDLGSYTLELREKLASLKLPSGYFVEVHSQYDNLQSALQRFLLIVPLTLLAIVTILQFAFGQVRPILIVLLNIPAASAGGILALGLRGLPFSISALVGLIAVMGVATMNAVVLLTSIYRRKAEGEALFDAATEGAEERLRPVLTTAIVASLGFVPMALSQGTGAEVQRPLATVVIGGLLVATTLTLFVLPSLAFPGNKVRRPVAST
jgi:heavy metal efflux system protein